MVSPPGRVMGLTGLFMVYLLCSVIFVAAALSERRESPMLKLALSQARQVGTRLKTRGPR